MEIASIPSHAHGSRGARIGGRAARTLVDGGAQRGVPSHLRQLDLLISRHGAMCGAKWRREGAARLSRGAPAAIEA